MKELIAEDLLKIKAVFFRPEEPFTWASGIKSPIYCDNRLTLSSPAIRADVENALCELINAYYPEAEILMGTATAGIAHAAICAHKLNLPMGYVRGSEKSHGRKNRIEGKLEAGQKTVVVEDLISTGQSCIDTCEALKEAGVNVLGIVSIFTYGLKTGYENLANAGYENHSATDYATVSQTALKLNYINEGAYKKLQLFINDPNDDSWTRA